MDNSEAIRAALIWNQAEAVRCITERDDRIEELEGMLDAALHTVMAQRAEISARGAACQALRAELMRESAKGTEPISEFRSSQ